MIGLTFVNLYDIPDTGPSPTSPNIVKRSANIYGLTNLVSTKNVDPRAMSSRMAKAFGEKKLST